MSLKPVEITQAKAFYAEQKAMIDTQSPRVCLPMRAFNKWISAFGGTPLTTAEFNGASDDELRAHFYSLPWPGVDKVVTAPVSPVAQTQPIDAAEEDQFLSAARYQMNAPKDSFLEFLVDTIGEFYPDLSLNTMREAFTKLLSVTQNYNSDLIAGEGKPITHAQMNAWLQAQTGSTYVCGALAFWNVLERIGMSCTNVPSGKPGKQVLCYEKGNKKLFMWDRYMVHSAWANDVEASAEEVAAFIGDLKFKGRFITYKPISHEAYRMAFMYLCSYKLTCSKDAPLTCDPIKPPVRGSTFKLPTAGDITSSIIDIITTAISAGSLKGPDAITAFENIARFIDTKVDQALLSQAILELDEATQDAYDYAKGVATELEKVKVMSAAERCDALEETVGSTGVAANAIRCLKDARDIRNATDANALVNHGVGSVTGHNMPEWVDTYHKGAMIVHYLLTRGLSIDETTKFNVYGIAYGHMTPVLNKLRYPGAPVSNMVFIDNHKATGSTEIFTSGDVHSHEEKGVWIIDDTDSHNLPQSYARNFPKYTGDHHKIELFVKNDCPMIVSKLKFKHFVTDDHLALWRRILYEDTQDYSWQLVKFGRLHNDECFLIGMKEPNSDCFDNLSGDIATVAHAIEVSNDIIMKWQIAGQRAGSVRPGYDEPLTMGHLWKTVVLALPVCWSWYVQYDPSNVEMQSVVEQEEQVIKSKIKYRSDDTDVGRPSPTNADVKVHDLPKRENVVYADGTKLAVGGTIKLGFGCSPELQEQIFSREVVEVKWIGDAVTGKWEASKKAVRRGNVLIPEPKPKAAVVPKAARIPKPTVPVPKTRRGK